MLQHITIINSCFENVSGDNNGHEREFEKEEENTFACKMCNYPIQRLHGLLILIQVLNYAPKL